MEEVHTLEGAGFQVGVFSNKGPRPTNQDAVIAGLYPLPFVFLADQAGGEGDSSQIMSVASYMAAKNMQQAVSYAASGEPETALRKGLKAAQRILQRFNRDHGLNATTTLVGGVRKGDKFHLLNVGDSQAFLVSRDGVIKERTKPHSKPLEMFEGFDDVDVQTAWTRKDWSNVITRWLGGEDDRAVPDTYVWEVESGDSLVIVSDGVLDANDHNPMMLGPAFVKNQWPTMTEDEIACLVSNSRSARQAAEALRDYARAHVKAGIGKPDNMAIAVFRFD
jgi:serine/threonine protein phosphatase PrpC